MEKNEVKKLKIGDKVKYEMTYNGLKKWWDAIVIDTNPLCLSIKFTEKFRHEAEPEKYQYKFIKL